MRVQGAVHLHEMGYLVRVAQAAGTSGLRARAAQAKRRFVRRLGGALHILSECCYAAPLHVHAESVTCDASERIKVALAERENTGDRTAKNCLLGTCGRI